MKREYVIINDESVTSPDAQNGANHAIRLLGEGWEKGESLGTEHLRVYEMRLYEAGEKATELLAVAADEAYAKAYKDWATSRGNIVHEVIVPFDTPETIKAAADAGTKTPQQELAGKGYVGTEHAVTKGLIMTRYERGVPPEPPPRILDYIRRKLTEEKKEKEKQ